MLENCSQLLKSKIIDTAFIVSTSDKISKKVFLKNLNRIEIELLTNLSTKILYPGSVICKNILINQLSFLEKIIKPDLNQIFILIQPIEIFKFARYQLKTKSLKLKLNYKLETKVLKNNKISYFHPELNLNLENKSYLINKKRIKNQELKGISFSIIKRKLLEPANFEYKNQTTYTLINSYQLTELGSLIKNQGLSIKEDYYIDSYQLKIKNSKKLVLFLSTKNNLVNIHTESSENFFFKEGDFIKKGDFVNSSLITETSGKIVQASKNNLKICKASPYLLSKGAFLFVSHNDFIEKDENLGVFLFEKTTTGDIVQGLPKVEEILEARKISSKGRLLKNFGLFLGESNYFIRLRRASKTNLLEKGHIVQFYQLIFLTKEEIKVYRRLQSPLKNLDPGNFVQLNFLIKDGTNLHKLLYNYYKYFSSFNSIYESCYRSLKKIQTLVITSIQQVYESQGVSISDKHVELIVRQMSSKIQVAQSGHTCLYCGDILELENIKYVNDSIAYSHKTIATYIPILNGITRSSLKTDSFISAASFQETTKVLTNATIEGRVDWLKGLKENVIVGRLIPAGTGFNIYNNLSNERTLPFYLKSP